MGIFTQTYCSFCKGYQDGPFVDLERCTQRCKYSNGPLGWFAWKIDWIQLRFRLLNLINKDKF